MPPNSQIDEMLVSRDNPLPRKIITKINVSRLWFLLPLRSRGLPSVAAVSSSPGSEMYTTLLARSALRRNVISQSARCFASRAPPPPKTLPKANPPPKPTQDPKRGAAQPSTPPEQTKPEPAASGQPLSSLPSLDFAPGEEPFKERTGARSSKDSLSSIERKRRFWSRVSIGVLLFGAGLQTYWMGRELTEEDLKEFRMKPEESPESRWGRTVLRFKGLFNTFTEPIWAELLPPPLPRPHQKPYTLLVSVDDLLVTSTWDRQHGWRTAKRPGVDYFLAYLSQFYEIVIFTTQYHYTALPILEKLDPYQFFITYKLFRDATRSVNGMPVKDLTYLNRDLSKVVILDTHPEHVSAQPENAVILPKWTGNAGDKGLVAIIPFLESIAIYKPSDVRPILEAYHGKDIPIEYAKKEAEAKAKHIEEWKNSRKGLSSGGFTLSKLFGSREHDSSPIPPTYLEQKRHEAQLQYQEEQAYIAANKDNFERLIKEEQDAMAKQMPNTFWGAAGAMLTPPPPGTPDSTGKPEGEDVKVVIDQPKSPNAP
ncbi:hypothetical protein NM688_g5555 [Phlebia brevispora]|uniref:Uncharacterized protein n=1 Tax=Phlebia brevispora TaxID=194682 RepID=A0ACC1STH8_9APHY|nr:hypothetical protein NM688_g5555 [Phlebia brevispora]